MNSLSNHRVQQKIFVVKNLVDIAILLSDSTFHADNCDYPNTFVDKHINRRLTKFEARDIVHVDTDNNDDAIIKKESIPIPFLGTIAKMSTAKKYHRGISQHLTQKNTSDSHAIKWNKVEISHHKPKL